MSYKDIRIDNSKHEVYVADTPVVLTVKEYDLLKLLVQNHENVVRRNDILDRIKKSEGGAKPVADDIPAQLEKLAKLKEAGILTEEEFNAKKADLLAKM